VETARAALRCDSCRIEIDDEPVERDGKSFCCDGCADGGPCTC
jgi:hypothetical protein